ncbi:MAG: hypothetical protein R3244_07910 [Thermoanaerobaculia bacterium]|nr:hypothetical protein [Thermoanaerobaculia bacterium]
MSDRVIRPRRTVIGAALGLAVLAALACAERGEQSGGVGVPQRSEIDPPARPGAFAVRLAAGADEILATWWEPLDAEVDEAGHRLLFARYTDAWSEPSVVVEGDDLFANWADFPAVVREPSGDLLVTWLAKTGEETYAYSIYLGRSHDDGATWRNLGKLNDDVTDTEHGFVSLVPEGDAVRAFWLDGRRMVAGGPMTVRTAVVGASVGPSELLDERVCECCPTDAVTTTEGALVAYRDRSDEEVREISAVGRVGDGWSEPERLTFDRWNIPGCPVNGPALDHRDGRTALAWYTGAEGAAHVGMRFLEGTPAEREPVVVDGERPLGRVGVVLDRNGDAVVSWLALVGKQAELRLRRVGTDGSLGAAVPIARTSASRSSGMPQLVRRGERFYLGWVEVPLEAPSRVRVSSIAPELVPAIGD